jgi:hypothetical protein
MASALITRWNSSRSAHSGSPPPRLLALFLALIVPTWLIVYAAALALISRRYPAGS